MVVEAEEQQYSVEYNIALYPEIGLGAIYSQKSPASFIEKLDSQCPHLASLPETFILSIQRFFYA